MHREGTKNYYYFDPDIEVMNKLIDMRNHAKKVSNKCQTGVMKVDKGTCPFTRTNSLSLLPSINDAIAHSEHLFLEEVL